MRRSGDFGRAEKLQTGVGEGGELGRALDDAIGTRSTVQSCCEKRFEKKTLQKMINSSTVVKVFESKCGQVVENLSTLFCACLVLWKERNLEIRANIQIVFKMCGKELPHLSNFMLTITARILARSLATFYRQ